MRFSLSCVYILLVKGI